MSNNAQLRKWLAQELRCARRAYKNTHPEARSPYIYGVTVGRIETLRMVSRQVLKREATEESIPSRDRALTPREVEFVRNHL